MILIDSNLLLYAYNAGSARFEPARAWLEAVFRGQDTIALPWAVIHAFLRISTNPHSFPRPYDPADALAIVALWFECSNIVILHPGERYWQIFRELMVSGPARNGCAPCSLSH